MPGRRATLVAEESTPKGLRVLVISPVAENTPGGVASHVSAQRKALAEQEIHTDLMVPEPQRGESIEFYAVLALRKLLTCCGQPIGFQVADRLRYRRLAGALRRAGHKYDVVHCHVMYTNLLGMILRSSGWWPPLVLTVHGYIADEAVSRGTISRKSKAYRHLLEQEHRIYDAASMVICVDSRTGRHVSRVSPSSTVRIIRNVVDTAVFKPTESTLIHRDLVVCPRMLNPKNGVGVAVRAMEKLAEVRQDLHLLVVGDGAQKRELMDYANVHGLSQMITFMGAVAHDRMAELIAQAGVVVIPSVPHEGVEEATSIAAIEALSCGVPVVASDIGGLREVITAHGAGGYLVPPNDPEQLAKAIVQALEARDVLASAAREVAVKNFSLAALGRTLAGVYHDVLAASDRRGPL